jgi:predicted nucleic acid-binding protein
MGEADSWFTCRTGYLETSRAVALAAGAPALRAFAEEWPSFGVVEVDQDLVESAAALALEHDLRSFDALHLASVLLLPRESLAFAAWDHRLHAAARAQGLSVMPEKLS